MATFLYNPERKPKNELIAEFVVRTDIYDEIMHDLETSKMDHPEQHYLLVGQRGAGKTTLLNRIKYGIEDSKLLKNWVIPIIFSEEQYNISELVNLWESVAQQLEDYYGFEGLYEAIEANQAIENFEELSYEILENQLKKKKKKLVLLIDNIGDMLKKMAKTEVHRLREILQTRNEMRFIVGSPFYLETVLDYHQPFFEFFKVLRLEGLSQEETQELLLKLGEMNDGKKKIEKIIRETPGRIETLRTLTGGVPRTIALMFNVFMDYNNEDTVKDLEKILDVVTPLYKHRMDDLPTQQQKIVDAVAKNWDGISVKELKEKVRIEGKTISAQLRQLEKNQVIETVETATKNNIYFLKERFFNIWYLMRYGRKYDKQRVIWLVKFLESWCTINEIEQRIIDFANKVKGGELDDHYISFYGEVYSGMGNLRSEMKIILKESTPKHLSKRIKVEDKDIIKHGCSKFDMKEYDKGIEFFKELEHPKGPESQLAALTILQLALEESEFFAKLVDDVYKKLPNNIENISYYEELLMFIFSFKITTIALVHKEFERAHQALNILIEVETGNDIIDEETGNLLLNIAITNFLVFDQLSVVQNTFDNNPILKDKLKPTYYATLKLLGLENELKKLGPELLGKVNEVLNDIFYMKKRIDGHKNDD
jgi:GTPase SAR1 family protein/Fe2+ or Zn2+ uptake regulation protein